MAHTLQNINTSESPVMIQQYETPDGYYYKLSQTVVETQRVEVQFPWVAIIILLILILGIGFFFVTKNDLSAGEQLDTTGKVFLDTDKRYLTDDDLESLHCDTCYQFEELIGFAINSIYAQNGLDYHKNQKYWDVFSQYDWYNPDTRDEQVVTSRFNKYENVNIDFLAKARSRNS